MKYYNDTGHCLFCQVEHCLQELLLRPLFLELNAFREFGKFTTEYLLKHSNILIDYHNLTIYYRIFSDLIVSKRDFSGYKTFYFFDPIVPIFDTSNDVNKLIFLIYSEWGTETLTLEQHGIEVVY